MDTEKTSKKPTPETPTPEVGQSEQPIAQHEPETVHIKHAHKLIYGYLILLVVAALVGLGGYWYHKSHKAIATSNHTTSTLQSAPKKPTSQAVTNPYAGWKIFSNDQAGLTFKYPADWVSKVTPNSVYTTGNTFAGTSGTITSPSGNTLYWVYQVAGGGDGPTCTPNPGDAPFAQGDKCESKQVLSVEQIPSVAPARGQGFRNLFEDNLYITETKLSGGYVNPTTGKAVNSGPSYFICLDPYYKPSIVNGVNQNPQPKVGMSMGFELPCNYWKTGFNVMFPVKSVADFSSEDAKAAILIMKSLNSYSAHSPADAVNVVQDAFQGVLDSARSTTPYYCDKACPIKKTDIDAAKTYMSAPLYNQLVNGIAENKDLMFCSETHPVNVSAKLSDASNGTATVSVGNILSTVDLNSLTITKITCP